MNRGTFRGAAPGIGDYQGLPPGGSWNGNRGRTHVDEFRMWGLADGQRNWLAQAGAARIINTNPQQGANPFYPGDLSMVLNILSGTVQTNNAGFPFGSMLNSAGRIRVGPGGSPGAYALLENNTIMDNVPGVAVALQMLGGVTSTTTYESHGAACTLAGLNDIASGPAFICDNSGTLAVTSYAGFSSVMVVSTGATVTTRTGYTYGDTNVQNSGVLTNQFGVDLPLMITATTLNTPLRIGRGGQTLTANVASNGLIDTYTGTTTVNFANAGALPPILNMGGTIQLGAAASFGAFTIQNLINLSPTYNSGTTNSLQFGTIIGLNLVPVIKATTATGWTLNGYSGFIIKPQITNASGGTITSGTVVSVNTGGTVAANNTITTWTGLQTDGPTANGTISTAHGVHIGNQQPSGVTVGYGLTIDAQPNQLHMLVTTSGPSNPTSNTDVTISIYKGATNYYLLVTFNDAATVRYRYMQLNGTTATWTEGTTLPT